MNGKKADQKARESRIRKWQLANRELIAAMADNPALIKIAEAAAAAFKK